MHFDLIRRGPVAAAFTFCCLALSGTAFAQASYPVAVYLEAECATVGENWTTVEDEMASGGTYVVAAEGFSSFEEVPEDIPANLVSFTVPVQELDSFRIHAHVKGTAPDNDSFWVRVNGGEWRSWDRRISDASGWVWREIVGSPYSSDAGQMTVDFAFREAGTQLDKLFVTTLAYSPQGIAQSSINCDEESDCVRFPESCTDQVWVEAECTDVQSQWRYRQDVSVSNGGYITNSTPSSLDEPTVDDEDNIVEVETQDLSAGTYYLFLRMNARDGNSNSLWVQIDNQPWINFSTELNGRELVTSGFEWRQVTALNDSTSFDLAAGSHTIRIAHRESGTYLDKIHLGKSATAPTGYGKFSFNCMENNLTPVREALDLASDLSVFPNPTSSQLSFSLTSAVTGRLEAAVYDFSGRRLQVSSFQKTGQNLREDIDVSTLPAGVYQLVIKTEAGVTSRGFVKN